MFLFSDIRSKSSESGMFSAWRERGGGESERERERGWGRERERGRERNRVYSEDFV